LAVRLNGPKAEGKNVTLNVDFTDLKKQYALVVEDGVLDYHPKFADKPDATLTLTKSTLDNIQLKTTTLEQAIASGDLKVDGNADAFSNFLGLLDNYPFWFHIVTP
jgi:alkyl sulfatase BDS1-like metallo-beta-lactamase superfamily hydrolase